MDLSRTVCPMEIESSETSGEPTSSSVQQMPVEEVRVSERGGCSSKTDSDAKQLVETQRKKVKHLSNKKKLIGHQEEGGTGCFIGLSMASHETVDRIILCCIG